MTLFEPVDAIEARALALPRMRPMLEALAQKHANLHPHMSAAGVRAAMEGRSDNATKDLPIDQAVMAGFVEAEDFRSNQGYKISLTDKGYEAIGATRPFWEGAA